MKKKIGILVLISLSMGIGKSSKAQIIGSSEAIIPDTFVRVKMFKTINIERYYSGTDSETQIVRERGVFYKMQYYYPSGKLKSKVSLSPLLVINRTYNGGFSDKDSMPERTVFTKIEYTFNGKYTEWYANGEIKTTGYFIWGQKHKVWRSYDSGEKLIEKTKWYYGVQQ